MINQSSLAEKSVLFRRIHKFTICFLLLPPLFCNAQFTEVSILDDGLAKLQKGNYSAAIGQFAKVLEQYPENYAANLGMGISLRETGRLDSALLYLDHAVRIQPTAESYLNRAVLFYVEKEKAKGERDEQTAMRMQPGSARIYELRGYCLLIKQDYVKAITVLDSAISKDKTTYKAYVNKASALSNLKKYEEAIAVLDRVIELNPDYLNAWYDRAYTYMLSGNMEQAFVDCNKLIALDGKNIDALLLRADIKDRSGDDAAAMEDCMQAIAIDPNNAKAYNLRALTRFDAHEYQEIIADCNKAIALKPDYYDPYIQRGDAYDDLGDFDKAIADYKKAISIDPTKLIAYRECAASVAHKNDYKGSLYYLNKGLQIEPDNKYLLEHKYQIQRYTGEPMGAISTLDQCIKHYPDSPMAYNMEKAYIYDSLHDNANACKFAFEALKGGLIDGHEYITAHPCAAYKKQPLVLAQPYILQAQKEYAMGMFNAEIASFTKALALLPDSPTLYYNRGAAKRKLNDFSGAIGDYNKAISLRPGFSDAIAARAVAKAYLNDIEGAKKDYQLLFKINPGYAIAYNNYASMIAETDVPGAIDYLTKAVHYNKKYTSAYLMRGKLYQKLGKKEEACADLKQAESLGSDDAKIERMVYCK
ncbi:tetratricopeptide repeat protein [Flavitalea sp. BT771]|uniref:tetratricopeptide repeat protein n=1 Tax=Flavitalea sp. BT771 TaxID=3063329 RepID=UPI0026E3BA77|nr:tetratricopeptide repeat protein [Flavitalea sp. BT771]MDO6435679.1 tetratricopeptide repeat protein [Flavitalea sp. BT771]MDV6224580.1 tetratricopeptide repeat protein [Flavitalea sp. BT771]